MRFPLTPQEEAVHAFDEHLKGRRDKLKPVYAHQNPPYAANQYTDAAFSATIQIIWKNASQNTKHWYDQGAVSGGDNWIICWMLYHACRYRDARNCKASPRFNDDDDLDENANEGIFPPFNTLPHPFTPFHTPSHPFTPLHTLSHPPLAPPHSPLPPGGFSAPQISVADTLRFLVGVSTLAQRVLRRRQGWLP